MHTRAVIEIQTSIISIAPMWCCAGCYAVESRTALWSKVVSCLRAKLLRVKTECAGSNFDTNDRVMRTAASRQDTAPDRTFRAAKDRDC